MLIGERALEVIGLAGRDASFSVFQRTAVPITTDAGLAVAAPTARAGVAKVKGLVEASIDGASQREDPSKIREGAGGNVWKSFLGWARGEERVDCECGKEGKLRRGSYSNRR